MWGALSGEKSGLVFEFLLGIASAAFLRSESHRTHDHSLLSLFLRLPQPGGPDSSIYFPQEQGSPVIPFLWRHHEYNILLHSAVARQQAVNKTLQGRHVFIDMKQQHITLATVL
jgi:hypothetical protein